MENLLSISWWLEVVAPPLLRSAAIVVVGLVIKFLLFRGIDKYVSRVETGVERERRGEPKKKKRFLRRKPDEGDGTAAPSMTARIMIGDDPIVRQRRALRARTIGTLFKTIVNITVWTFIVLIVMGEFGFNVGPLIAGAGIFGVALGFGAQSLVADFLSGVFMLMEDQYGVGDIIDMGEASGTVEDVSLRVTQLRSVDGVVWYVRNGEVVRLGNMSQGWSRTVLDVGVAYGEDTARVKTLLTEISGDMARDPEWESRFLEEPVVLGVEDLAADSVVIRVSMKTSPGEQWAIARELRERIKQRFDAEGVEIPFQQRTVWHRTEQSSD